MAVAIYFMVVAALLALVSAQTFGKHGDIIREHVKGFKTTALRAGTVGSCTISDSNSCSLSSLPTTQSTFVYPGGKSRCIFDSSTPYAFQVWRGASDKLLVYFQGGGACWDKISTDANFCSTDISAQSEEGIFDRANVNNKFRDFTIIHLSYCSGDVWGGNTTRPYTNMAGSPVVQVGQENGQATLNWILAQQASGALASTLNSLVVMGCSAGSIGAQLWGNPIISQVKHVNAAVVPDSYAGVFPSGSQGPLVKGFNLCSWPYLPAGLGKKCQADLLTIQDINMANQAAQPSVPYSFIQSKTDIVQQSFYVAVGATTPGAKAEITPEEFYSDVVTVFGTYNANANFLTYLVDGDQHCYTPHPLYVTADGLSSTDNNGPDNVGPKMIDWTNAFPLQPGQSQSTLCEGTLQAPASGSRKLAVNNQTYCSTTVVPKSFTEN